MASWIIFPVTSVAGTRCDIARLLFLGSRSVAQVKGQRAWVRCSLDSLDTKVSDMSVNAPKGLFPPEPEHYRGPKLKVAIIGAGLASMSTAVELLDQGHEVDIYESRSFIGGKVGSFVDKHGNHIEMGLHVFFGWYNNLFRLMKKVGADNNLLVKDHTHTFVNKGVKSANWILDFQSERHYMEFVHFYLQISFRKKKVGMQRYCDVLISRSPFAMLIRTLGIWTVYEWCSIILLYERHFVLVIYQKSATFSIFPFWVTNGHPRPANYTCSTRRI